MTDSLVDPQAVPAELRSYLEELVRRTRSVCGDHVVGVFAVGSVALGDYRHGRSDVDVTVVADPALPQRAVVDLAEELTDLDCPAAGLELVLYDADFAGQPSERAGYRLNLNSGPLLEYQASFDSTEAPAFWFVIDRAVGYQSGRLLYGRPVRQVLAPTSRAGQLAAVLSSIREHSEGTGHLADNRVLNGCRSVVFCRTDRWVSKPAAAQAIATDEPAFRALVEQALHSFRQPRSAALPLPSADVQNFLAWVRERVEHAASRA
ncbi:aminoglycoside adenylyltransferase domain-containing protein [Nocardia sp. BMG51109]|uniref:aminoglycoside adenylyltransferase domain-containing protein n=1 Tax=Nocardia sp. BMG51109 TaxID=1056816 RepID=UPI0004B94096|nr:aminoglycoside adenylyltransferase domain-containing protein [Nocardia sp. BMG51109]